MEIKSRICDFSPRPVEVTTSAIIIDSFNQLPKVNFAMEWETSSNILLLELLAGKLSLSSQKNYEIRGRFNCNGLNL